MAKTVQKAEGMSIPILGMLVMAIAGGLLVGASFVVITAWPQPISIAPYFEDSLFLTGFTWGFVFGGAIGWTIGFMTDESHFSDVSYE
jgi:hypothetical protein